jgi:hypothetical protein
MICQSQTQKGSAAFRSDKSRINEGRTNSWTRTMTRSESGSKNIKESMSGSPGYNIGGYKFAGRWISDAGIKKRWW